MNPANVFQMEMAMVLAVKRRLFLRLGVTFLLGLPFVILVMPMRIRVVGLLMLLIFSGFFGAAVSFVRRRTDGHLGRLYGLPVSKWAILGDLLMAGAVVDVIQVGAVLVVYGFFHGCDMHVAFLLETIAFFVIAVLVLNLLGMGLGYCLTSNPEVHLFGAFGAGLIAFMSGLLPAPAATRGLIDTITPWNPLARLGFDLQGLTLGIEAGSHVALASGLTLMSFAGLLLLRAVDWEEVCPSTDQGGSHPTSAIPDPVETSSLERGAGGKG